MKYITTFCLCLFVFAAQQINAQAQSENGYYLVEFDKFTPPVQDMIKSYEGFPAAPFMANDMDGEERFLGDFKGKPLVLYFWNRSNSDAVSLLYDLNLLKKKFGKKVNVIAMGDDTRADIEEFIGEDKMDIIIIPNSKMLSEAVYGIEMGYPRIFLIDESGIIRSVIPEEFFSTNGDHAEVVQGAVKALMK